MFENTYICFSFLFHKYQNEMEKLEARVCFWTDSQAQGGVRRQPKEFKSREYHVLPGEASAAHLCMFNIKDTLLIFALQW